MRTSGAKRPKPGCTDCLNLLDHYIATAQNHKGHAWRRAIPRARDYRATLEAAIIGGPGPEALSQSTGLGRRYAAPHSGAKPKAARAQAIQALPHGPCSKGRRAGGAKHGGRPDGLSQLTWTMAEDLWANGKR